MTQQISANRRKNRSIQVKPALSSLHESELDQSNSYSLV